MIGKMDLSRIKIRLDNIRRKATASVSLEPSDVPIKLQEFYSESRLICLEDLNSDFSLDPQENAMLDERNIYAYDESTQDYRALEGDLLFCSSAVMKIEDKYAYNLTVLPHFITSMRKFSKESSEEIHYTENPTEERNRILVNSKTESILEATEPNSVVLIDGPLVGGMASSYMIRMDDALRKENCIPVYFVKNSSSRLVVDNVPRLSDEFNSDFHWAAHRLKAGSRSALFKYTDQVNPRNSKVFTYVKALVGFPERVEMHTLTYEKYAPVMPALLNLIAYFYVVQGDYTNPQVRPVAIAEKYAREGLRVLNIPALLLRMGFHPTINQVRFG